MTMTTTKATRTITEQDRIASANLKRIYENKKHDLNLTQYKIADMLGLNQSSIGQILNGHQALNVKTVLRMASVLKCRPEEIDPNFRTRFPDVGLPQPVDIIKTYPQLGVFRDGKLTITHELPLSQRAANEYMSASLDSHTECPGLLPHWRFLVNTRSRIFKAGNPVIVERRKGYGWVYTLEPCAIADNQVQNVENSVGTAYPVSLIQPM